MISGLGPDQADTEAASRRKALEMVGKIALIIFVVEAGIMLVLEQLRPLLHPLAENFIDALTLMTIASPIIYFVAVRPFVVLARDANTGLERQLERAETLLAANFKLQASLQEATEAQALSYDRVLQKIGADLHDGPAQLLSYVLLMFDRAQGLAKKTGNTSDVEAMQKLRSVLSDAMREVRGISTGLSLPELSNLSLEETVRLVIRRHNEISTLPVDSNFEAVPETATDAQKVCIYRFVQECLSNIRKHSGASRATVLMRGGTQSALRIIVRDDGRGFDASGVHAGLGLTGMKARLHALGGGVSITSMAGAGTEVSAEMTLEKS